ncbi:MAG TPA: CPBP family intramembrane glutamic endopeptidase [Thermoanaerobaculia bacterium]|nr:CPBP family intramembrane glutamic endopeptidase [Thermoanaerobaculia bacterium]
MTHPGEIGIFLLAAVAAALLWGRGLWYLDERSRAFHRLVLFVLGFTRRRAGEVRAALLSGIYYLLGLLGALAFAGFYRVRLAELVAVSASHLGLAVLGVVGEISLADLLVGVGARAMRAGPARFAELKEVPWMKGLCQLPPGWVPVAAALGGVVEELFFRGVLLTILLRSLAVAPWVAVALAGALFTLEQLLQVRTRFQALVLGSGCAALSLVGGLLVVLTGSVVPALLCHASFVVFFLPPFLRQPGPRREAVAA